jgi:hypothetical protein
MRSESANWTKAAPTVASASSTLASILFCRPTCPRAQAISSRSLAPSYLKLARRIHRRRKGERAARWCCEGTAQLGLQRARRFKHSMPVVGHHTNGVQKHARAFSGERQAVLDVLIGGARWAQQELPLRAAACDQIASPVQDLSRQRHGHASVTRGNRFRALNRRRRPRGMAP